MSDHWPTLQRLHLGKALRQAREAIDKRQEEAASVLDCYTSKISRIETGLSGLRTAELEKLLDFYGVDGSERDELLALGKVARRKERRRLYGDSLPNWFRRYLDLEADASQIWAYEGEVIPGLLQTGDYARALIRAALFGKGPDDVDRRVKIRMDRQALLTRRDPPPLRLWCVIGEAAFARPVGGPGVMRLQIEHILDATAEPTSVVVQVLPFSAGEHVGLGGCVNLLCLEGDRPAIGYMDSLGGGGVYVEREGVELLIEVFDHLRATALGPDESRRFLWDLAKRE